MQTDRLITALRLPHFFRRSQTMRLVRCLAAIIAGLLFIAACSCLISTIISP